MQSRINKSLIQYIFTVVHRIIFFTSDFHPPAEGVARKPVSLFPPRQNLRNSTVPPPQRLIAAFARICRPEQDARNIGTVFLPQGQGIGGNFRKPGLMQRFFHILPTVFVTPRGGQIKIVAPFFVGGFCRKPKFRCPVARRRRRLRFPAFRLFAVRRIKSAAAFKTSSRFPI